VALLKQDKYQDALEAIAVRRDAIDVAADELMLEKVGSTPRAPHARRLVWPPTKGLGFPTHQCRFQMAPGDQLSAHDATTPSSREMGC